MATYAKGSFNAKLYAAARPTYPRQLFDFIFRYHEHGPSSVPWRNQQPGGCTGKARWDVAVDLGCGTGQATRELHPFKRIVGVDPSAKMLDGARKHLSTELGGLQDGTSSQYEFVKSPAESLDFIEDGSVDLVVSAQAAHWFDWRKLWPELARVLRKNGTVAVWGYSEMRLSRYPSLTPLIHKYSKGTDPSDSLGPYWEQPGRDILDNHLQDIASASSVIPDVFSSEDRVYFSGTHHPSFPNAQPIVLRKKMTWEGYEAYLRSFSSLHTFQLKNPGDLKREEGDIVKRFIALMKAKTRKFDSEADADSKASDTTDGSRTSAEEVVIEWPVSLILAKRA